MSDVLAILDRWSADEQWRTELEQSLRTDADAWVAAVQEPGALSTDRAWTLLGWVETSASALPRRRSDDLLATSAFALALLEEGPLDRRDVLVVASVVRRSARLAGLRYADGVRAGCERAGVLGERAQEWLPWVSADLPPTHVEVGEGTDRHVERRPSTLDVDALTRWARGE